MSSAGRTARRGADGARGERDAGLLQLEKAIAITREQGARMLELRSTVERATQDADRGRPLLREVMTELPEPEPWPDVQRASHLLT